MAADQVDALVIFGATGDLAKLETFPALVGLVRPRRAGRADRRGVQSRMGPGPVPRLRRRLADTQHHGPESPAATHMLDLLRYVDGDLGDEGTYQAMSAADRRGPAGAVLPGGAAAAVRPDRPGHCHGRARQGTGSWWRNRSVPTWPVPGG